MNYIVICVIAVTLTKHIYAQSCNAPNGTDTAMHWYNCEAGEMLSKLYFMNLKQAVQLM
jgi:hypothetical protein